MNEKTPNMDRDEHNAASVHDEWCWIRCPHEEPPDEPHLVEGVLRDLKLHIALRDAFHALMEAS